MHMAGFFYSSMNKQEYKDLMLKKKDLMLAETNCRNIFTMGILLMEMLSFILAYYDACIYQRSSLLTENRPIYYIWSALPEKGCC